MYRPPPLRGRQVFAHKRVLLIDLCQASREVRASILLEHGVEVHQVPELSDARFLWKRNLYDLVMLEVRWYSPGESLEFYEQIKDTASGAKLRVPPPSSEPHLADLAWRRPRRCFERTVGGDDNVPREGCVRRQNGACGLGSCSHRAVGMDRVHFILHESKRILLIDFTNCRAEEVMKVLGEVQRVVTAQPRKSVLIVSDLTGAEFNRVAVTRMKEVAVFDRPYVKRAALVGAESLPEVFYKALKTFSQREFPRFKTRDEALEWLVQEGEG